MSLTLKEIAAEALNLDIDERAILANKLLSSFDSETDPDIEQLWIEEAERRYRDIVDGKTKTIPAEQVFSEIRERLNAQRRV